MIDVNNIRSLSDFQRNTREHVKRLKATGKPEVLTVNGQAELVVQSAEAYQKLLEDLELIASIKSIRRGLDQAKRGEGKPAKEFLKELASKHGVKLAE